MASMAGQLSVSLLVFVIRSGLAFSVDKFLFSFLLSCYYLLLLSIIETSGLSNVASCLKGVYIRKGKLHSVWL